jgi:hypothetical protein
MKNQNTIFIAIAFALAFALAPLTGAQPSPQGGPTRDAAPAAPASEQPCPLGADCAQLPVVSIHSTGDILRGKTGSFVLEMKPALMFGAMFVNFKVSGTAVAGVDYKALISPAYIGQSGYATILVHTLADPRGSSNRQAYSVVVTLEAGAGYALGAPNSATIWIKP